MLKNLKPTIEAIEQENIQQSYYVKKTNVSWSVQARKGVRTAAIF